MTVDLIQFMMPDGHQKPVSAEISDECKAGYAAVLEHGFKLHCEMLTTGEVSCTIFDPKEEDDVSISVTPNGPEVQRGIERMIRDFQNSCDERQK